jgi:hypothetical protein
MKLKLKFHGPNTVSNTTKEAPIQIGHAISFETPLLKSERMTDLQLMQRIFEMERTFNELTAGRLHVSIEDD